MKNVDRYFGRFDVEKVIIYFWNVSFSRNAKGRLYFIRKCQNLVLSFLTLYLNL
ncbi:hypothetical protein HanPSC8_Chr02g0073211 [Helianthus annuus]|nr:hypothetical protein HanPSC8_Chr02g0073211 [Helianthus annuus]